MATLSRRSAAAIIVVLVATGGCAMTAGSTGSTRAMVGAADPRIAPFVGAWRLVRQEGRNTASNELVPSQTSDAWPGLLVYTPDGWMSVTIDRRPTGGTYWGYFGTFHVSGDTLVHNIDGGTPSVRGPSPALYRFEGGGERLVISTLPNPASVVVHYAFERAR